MKRLLIVSAATVGACAIAVPAAAGLAGNPSFSERVPVRVPSTAKTVTFDDHGGARSTTPAAPRPSTASPTTTRPTTTHPTKTRHVEPGDDRGTHVEPGDDRGTHVEPGDDRGTHVEPGDDNRRNRGGSATRTATVAPATGTPATGTPTAGTSAAGHGHGADDATGGHGGRHGSDD